MTINPVGSYIDPAFASQNGTLYKNSIDNSILTGKRFTDMFAPHEVNQPIETFVPSDVNTGTDKITLTATGLIDDMAVILTNDQDPKDPPAGLTDGVTYFVINQAVNDIELSATQGGAKIDLTDQGTGINTLSPAPSMLVQINPGFIWDGVTLTETALQITATLIAPSVNPRIDRITRVRSTGVIVVTTGVENSSPVPPAFPSDNDPICQIAFTTSTTAIDNILITDERAPQAPTVVTPIGTILAVAGTWSDADNGGSYNETGVLVGFGWKECDGSQISGGPFDTRYVPKLNDGRFLRGHATAGTVGGQATKNPFSNFAAAGNFTPGATIGNTGLSAAQTGVHNHAGTRKGSGLGGGTGAAQDISDGSTVTGNGGSGSVHGHSHTGSAVARNLWFLNSAVNIEPVYFSVKFYQRIA